MTIAFDDGRHFLADNERIVIHEELGPDGFIVRDAVPTSDVIRIRFADIDGLRALAIVLVCCSAIVPLTRNTSPALDRFAAVGNPGLALFFVLSGFALAFPAMAVLRQDGGTYLDIGRYIVRRLVRLYPAYAVALALTALCAPFVAKYAPVGFSNVTPTNLVANLFFAGDGFGNDGFRVLAVFARAYIAFPVLLLLWARAPIVFGAAIAAIVALDTGTFAHTVSLGAFVPFMLGIVAADVRAQSSPIARYAPVVLAIGAVAGVVLHPLMASTLGYRSAPHAFAIEPAWSFAAFGLLVTVGAYRPLERLCGFWMLRVVGAASYSLSLVVVPIASVLAVLGPRISIAAVVPLTAAAGILLWQFVDRWFNDGAFRRTFATDAAAPIDRVLACVRADRVFLGTAAPATEDEQPNLPESSEEFVPNFYAPPPRPTVADLAIVSRRTGSPEELAAEILETKARLQQRSAELFGTTALESGPPAPVYPKPGFYRKQANESNLPFEDVEDPFALAPSDAAPSHASQQMPSGQAIRLHIGSLDGTFHG